MTNARFNDNRLKLGVFGLNVSNGRAATIAEGHLQPTWQNNLGIAAMAEHQPKPIQKSFLPLMNAGSSAKGAVRAQGGDKRAATGCRASSRWEAPKTEGRRPAGGWDCSGAAGWPAWRLHRPHRSHRT